MGVADCDGCEDCKATLAEGPDGHREIAEHDWHVRWTIDPKTGVRGKERLCFACGKHETLPIAEEPS